MNIFKNSAALQKWVLSKKRQGSKIALVPTMGYLHDGHLSLIKKAKTLKADEIIVSIFVNPTQFCPGEDFEKYPRDEKADLAKCRQAGATAVYIPSAKDVYEKDHSVYVDETRLSVGLCGARRPGHFRGVCTVVTKLFNISQADVAVFGRKDYQQAAIIKRMVRDMNFPVKIVVAPIVREKSGLAMSSRNTYLSEIEKENALEISRSLRLLKSKAIKFSHLTSRLKASGLKVDYIEAVNADTLEKVANPKKGDVVLIAAYSGKTRLIDNITL
ncbi:MAG: pantoate--beta-alanine ligase [Kiritimatiellae bacterium]|nr:pantoate--beta-alanine ligase [Kiritimatiellia bacterium]